MSLRARGLFSDANGNGGSYTAGTGFSIVVSGTGPVMVEGEVLASAGPIAPSAKDSSSSYLVGATIAFRNTTEGRLLPFDDVVETGLCGFRFHNLYPSNENLRSPSRSDRRDFGHQPKWAVPYERNVAGLFGWAMGRRHAGAISLTLASKVDINTYDVTHNGVIHFTWTIPSSNSFRGVPKALRRRTHCRKRSSPQWMAVRLRRQWSRSNAS